MTIDISFFTSVPVYNIWRAFYSLSCSINSVIVYSAKYSYNNVVTIGDSWALNIVKNYNTILRVFTTVSQKRKNLYSSKLYYVLVCYCHCVSADVDGDQFNFVPFCDKQGETESSKMLTITFLIILCITLVFPVELYLSFRPLLPPFHPFINKPFKVAPDSHIKTGQSVGAEIHWTPALRMDQHRLT